MARGILNRIVLMVLLAAVLLPGSLRAQRIGQVEYGSRIFSTGLPRYPIPWAEDFTPPMMTKPINSATAIPIQAGFTFKVLENDMAMPLDCTGGMKKPAASTAHTANTTANHLLFKPFSI